MYLCRTIINESFPKIGTEFGGKDHSTVMHSCDKIEKEIINYNDDIRYDFYYYMGIIERLISYIELIDISKLELVLSHKKRYNNTIDYYNPFNLCVDLKYRDLIYYLLNNDIVYKLWNYIGYINSYERKYILFSLLKITENYLM